jgi:hypothetical protein
MLFTRGARNEERGLAIDLVQDEVMRLAELGARGVRALAGEGPVEVDHDGIVVCTSVNLEGERLLVLVEAWRGRRTLATAGFAMAADGTTHTPH